jgi:stalled ribosome rescue protein Dom34
MKLLPEPLLKKTVAATISATGSSAMAELVRRPELKHVLQQERYTHEVTLMDQLLTAIHTDKGAWGEQEVATMAESGALLFVLVSKNLLQRTREEGRYETLRKIMHDAERTKAQVHVLDTSAAQQLDTLGGIGGVRRW